MENAKSMADGKRSLDDIELRPVSPPAVQTDEAHPDSPLLEPRLRTSPSHSPLSTQIPQNSRQSFSIQSATLGNNNESPKSGQKHASSYESRIRSFFRSIGLKIIFSGRRLKFQHSKAGFEEQPKIVESDSLSMAIVRTSVHILPGVTTIFLICFNAVGFLNGPSITGGAQFFLQLLAKFHELTIVGSLTVIALDLVRYHLTNDGINLGLLSAGLSFAQLNWLWSTDFLSGFRVSMPRWAKFFVLLTLALCCILASTVGPASALLFIPTELWLPAASTKYYAAGTEDDLYPLKLIANNTGPDYCKQSPLVFNPQCLHAGWRNFFAEMSVVSPVRPGWSFLMTGASGIPSRIISGTAPDQNNNYKAAYESWATTISVVMAISMNKCKSANDQAWAYAKGRNRRLRDFIDGGGGYAISWGKIPVTRTVCGNLTTIRSDSNKLEFPILSRDKYWRSEHSIGPIQEVDITAMNLGINWESLQRLNLSHQQVRAKWTTLPSGFEESTSAGLIFISQSDTTAVARGCVVDARWGEGENLRKAEGCLHSLEAQVGKQKVPDNADYGFSRGSYFEERYRPYYGPTIAITDEWLDGLILPMPEQTSVGSDFMQTNFEALLNKSKLAVPLYSQRNLDDSRILLEYFITIFLTDALSRIGYALQTDRPDTTELRPELRQPRITSDLMLNGGPIYQPPSFPHQSLHYQTYKYGTAWCLSDSARRISIVILLTHMLLALVHFGIVVRRRSSSEAWDSINELIALAYNSSPKEGTLKNCSGGIVLMDTLKKKVKVRTKSDGVSVKKAELVVIDKEASDKNSDVRNKVTPGERYS